MGACGATCGINRERERERERALEAVARAYPGYVWRAEAPFPFGVDADAIVALGRELEELLPVRAIFRPSAVGACDWLYLLAGFASPCLVEIADGACASDDDDDDDDDDEPVEETYVRLGFSPLGRYVTMQEVTVRATTETRNGPRVIVHEPHMGVSDRRLQAIVKGLQGKLRKEKLVVLDMAYLAMPIADVASATATPPAPQTAFRDAFGAEPLLFAFLFEPAPPSATFAVLAHGESTAVELA